MKSKIHHVSISVQDYDWYAAFFSEVFQMTVERTRGEKPKRQLWFSQGIQINEVPEKRPVDRKPVCDHFSIGVDIDPVEAAGIAIAHGCHKAEGKGPHWFKLPNGVEVELKPIR